MIVRGTLYGNFLLWSQYLTLWAKSQTLILQLTSNSRRSDENDTLPDCGHHGDDSFQEDHFSGIPTTLCINVGFFMITVIIFSLIRKRAWGYGEINADSSREMYYRYFFHIFQLLFFLSHEASSGEDSVNYRNADQKLIDEEKRSKNIFKWIKLVFYLSDDAYLKKCGKSSVAYLTFQVWLGCPENFLFL